MGCRKASEAQNLASEATACCCAGLLTAHWHASDVIGFRTLLSTQVHLHISVSCIQHWVSALPECTLRRSAAVDAVLDDRPVFRR
jgi:hypothetical protein